MELSEKDIVAKIELCDKKINELRDFNLISFWLSARKGFEKRLKAIQDARRSV